MRFGIWNWDSVFWYRAYTRTNTMPWDRVCMHVYNTVTMVKLVTVGHKRRSIQPKSVAQCYFFSAAVSNTIRSDLMLCIPCWIYVFKGEPLYIFTFNIFETSSPPPCQVRNVRVYTHVLVVGIFRSYFWLGISNMTFISLDFAITDIHCIFISTCRHNNLIMASWSMLTTNRQMLVTLSWALVDCPKLFL